MSWLDRLAARAGVEREWNLPTNVNAPSASATDEDNAWKYISVGDFSGLSDYTDREYDYRKIPFWGQFVGHAADAATDGIASLAQFAGFEKAGDFLHNEAQKGEAQLPSYTKPSLSLDYITDPNGLASAAGMVTGSMLSIAPVAALVPESAVAGAVTAASKVPKIGGPLSRFVGNAIRWAPTGPVEAAMEGGAVEREMLENGASREDANRAAWDVFKGNAALLTATNAVEGGLLGKLVHKAPTFSNPIANTFSKIFNYVPQTAAEMAVQGYEEGAQEGISRAAMGQGEDSFSQILNPVDWTDEQWDAAKMGAAGSFPLVGGTAMMRHLQGALSSADDTEDAPTANNAPTLTSGNAEIDDAIVSAAAKHGLPADLLFAVAQTESDFDQSSVSSTGAKGIMQLMPDTAAALGVDADDMVQNIEGGARYLKQQLDDFGGNVEMALAAYNAGPGAVEEYKGVPPYEETQNYVAKIMGILDGANMNPATEVGAARSLLDDAEPFIGTRMDNGTEGCVEAVTKIGAAGSDFLRAELEAGVVNVDRLVEDAGDRVIPFDASSLEEGDVIVYGDKNDAQRHVVLYDGKGGYIGNSSSQNLVVHASDYNAMGNYYPTKIIKSGGRYGGAVNISSVSGSVRPIDYSGLVVDAKNLQANAAAMKALIEGDKLTPAQKAAIIDAAEIIRDTPMEASTVSPAEDALDYNAWQRLIDHKDVKGIFAKDPERVTRMVMRGEETQRKAQTAAAIENQQKVAQAQAIQAQVQAAAQAQPVANPVESAARLASVQQELSLPPMAQQEIAARLASYAQTTPNDVERVVIQNGLAHGDFTGIARALPEVYRAAAGRWMQQPQEQAQPQPQTQPPQPTAMPAQQDMQVTNVQANDVAVPPSQEMTAQMPQQMQGQMQAIPTTEDLADIRQKLSALDAMMQGNPTYVEARRRGDWQTAAQEAAKAGHHDFARFYQMLHEKATGAPINITPYQNPAEKAATEQGAVRPTPAPVPINHVDSMRPIDIPKSYGARRDFGRGLIKAMRMRNLPDVRALNDDLRNGEKRAIEHALKRIAQVDAEDALLRGETAAQRANDNETVQAESRKKQDDDVRAESAQNEGEAVRAKSAREQENKKATDEGSVVVTGREFGEYADIKELRKKALQYYKEHLQGTSVENALLGEIDIDDIGLAEFTGSGKRELKNSSAKEEKLLLVKHLPALIHDATDISGKKSSKENHAGEYFYYLHTTAKINGEETPVEITLVKRNNRRIQYYNHTLPTLEKNKKIESASVSTEPESLNGPSETPSIHALSSTTNIPSEQEKSKEKSVQAKSAPLTKQEQEALTGTSEEAKEAYRVVRDKLAKSKNKAVVRAAKVGATLFARHADIYAKAYSKATGKPYTALDYLQDKFGLDADGKEVNGRANGFEQRKTPLSDAERKKMQLHIIQDTNPMNDDIHTGVRSTKDILSAKEAFETKVDENSFAYPDFTEADGRTALRRGYVEIYSSHPIVPGAFVTPSQMQAKDYAGSGRVYSKRVPLRDVAWLHSDEGQYAPVEQESFDQSAWHGTPHDFDVFDLGGIGTGEGAQVHGWGLYSAQGRDVAEGYRENLSSAHWTYNGKSIGIFAERERRVLQDVKNMYVSFQNSAFTAPAEKTVEAALRYVVKQHTREIEGLREHIGAYDTLISLLEPMRKQKKSYDAASKEIKGKVDNYTLLHFPDIPSYAVGTKTAAYAIKVVKAERKSYRERLEEEEKAAQIAKSLDAKKFSVRVGYLYKVEIPDKDVLLDEQKPFDEQSKFVQEKLQDVFADEDRHRKDRFADSIKRQEQRIKDFDIVLNENAAVEERQAAAERLSVYEVPLERALEPEFRRNFELGRDDAEYYKEIDEERLENYETILKTFKNGKEIYESLSMSHGGDKVASRALNGVGIKGITYDGRQDGRCYVIFDDKAIKILEKFSARHQEALSKVLEEVELVAPEKLSKRQQGIADFGKEMGMPVVFFKGAKNLHGFHASNGVTFLNTESETSLRWTFWHEALHWMKANNEELFAKLIEDVERAGTFTKAQLDGYRKEIGAFDLSDAEVIEEMLADALPDVKRRVPFLKDLGKRNRSLAERFVGWIREVMDRFRDFFHTPARGLTTAQSTAMRNAFAALARDMVDERGRRIFRVDEFSRRITLANGSPLPSAKYSLDNREGRGDNEDRISKAVFDKHLNDGIMKMVEERVRKEIGEHVDFAAMSDPVARDAARDGLPYIKKMLVQYNIIKAQKMNPAYADRYAVMIEYARRCFDNDSRVGREAARGLGQNDGQGRMDSTGNENHAEPNVGRSAERGGRSTLGISSGVGKDHAFARVTENFDNDERIRNEAVRRVVGVQGQGAIHRADVATLPTGGQGESRSNGRRAGLSRSVSGEKSGARAHFEQLYEDMKKHPETGAFSMIKFSRDSNKPGSMGMFRKLLVKFKIGEAAESNLEVHRSNKEKQLVISASKLNKFMVDKALTEKNILKTEDLGGGKIRVTYMPQDFHNIHILDWLKSVRQLRKKNPFVKAIYDLGSRAMRLQEHLRNEGAKTVKEFHNLTKNKNDRELVTSILLEGDAAGKEYGVQELRAMGANANVIKAYQLVRRTMREWYKRVNDARMQVETRTKTLSKNDLADFKKNHWIADSDVLSVEEKGDGKVLLTWRGGKTYETKDKVMTKTELDTLLQDKDINVAHVHKLNDSYGVDNYSVDYVERIKPLGNLTGYMPHFFHEWMVYEKHKDPKTGEVRLTTIGSGRSMNDAVRLGNEIARKNSDKEYVVRPKGFDLNVENSVVIGDADFQQMAARLAAETQLTLADANAFLRDSAGATMRARHRFFGNAMHRKGAKGFDTDITYVLTHYLNTSARYIAMEQFKPRAVTLYERWFGAFDAAPKDDTAKYVKGLIKDINGDPRPLEKSVSELIMKTPIGKMISDAYGDRAALAVNGELSTWNAISKLGLGNFASAAVNLSQFINIGAAMNDYVYAANGLKSALKPTAADMKILEESGVLDEINQAADNGGYTQRRFGRVGSVYGIIKRGGELSLLPFQYADVLMRKTAILGAYKQGVEKLGLSHEEAMERARDINYDANFDYSAANAPLMIRAGSVVTQQMFQFQKYPIMQMEFMYNILKNGTRGQKVRFLLPYVLMCGIPGIVPFGEIFNQIFSFLFRLATGDDKDIGDEIKAEALRWAGKDPVKKAIVNASIYGVLAPVFGIDVSKRIGISGAFSGEFFGAQKPESVLDVLGMQLGGPMASTAVNMANQVHNGNPIEALKAFSPALGNMAQAMVGVSRTTRHRVKSRYETTYDRIIHAMGFRSVDESNNSFITSYEFDRKDAETHAKQEAIMDYLDDPSEANRQRINALGIKDKAIEEARIQQERSATERAKGGRPKVESGKTSKRRTSHKRKEDKPKKETLFDTIGEEDEGM